MNEKALARSPIGFLVDVSGHDPRFGEHYSCKAYVPNPLPAELPLSAKTYSHIIEATSALARADEAVSLLPSPNLFVRPAIRREAVSTSALEGTYATLDEAMTADFLTDAELAPSVIEVRNYVRAAEHAIEWISNRRVTRSLLEDLQSQLVRGTASEGRDSGHVRTTQVFIGLTDQRVEESRFVPPPPGDLLRDGVMAWLDWFNDSLDVPIVARAALAHYQFEALHPFSDGNGRLGRLAVALQFQSDGILRVPVMNISSWLERRRDQYQDQLFRLSATGDFDTWIQFFATAVRAQAFDTSSRSVELRKLQHEMVHEAATHARGAAVEIARNLIGYPVLNVRTASQLCNVSFPAANRGISKLVELGMLEKLGSDRYARLFANREVLQILGRETSG